MQRTHKRRRKCLHRMACLLCLTLLCSGCSPPTRSRQQPRSVALYQRPRHAAAAVHIWRRRQCSPAASNCRVLRRRPNGAKVLFVRSSPTRLLGCLPPERQQQPRHAGRRRWLETLKQRQCSACALLDHGCQHAWRPCSASIAHYGSSGRKSSSVRAMLPSRMSSKTAAISSSENAGSGADGACSTAAAQASLHCAAATAPTPACSLARLQHRGLQL